MLVIEVELSSVDALSAACTMTVQMMRKIAKQRTQDHGSRSTRGEKMRWADALMGAMGELAVSHGLHMEWTPGGVRVKRGDIHNWLEVRGTDHDDGHLLVYEADAEDALFVFAVGMWPRFRLVGWLPSIVARQEKYWRADANPPCWWVPQGELYDLAELKALLP